MELRKNGAWITFQISKKVEKMESTISTLSNEIMKTKSGEVFNSTCLPSGNLVDGLPLIVRPAL